MYQTILSFHILAATVWTGGHIVLAAGILPHALIEKNIDRIVSFESDYEKVGIPALFVQVTSGIWLAYQRIPDFSAWVDWGNPISRLIIIKLLLLLITVSLAIDARFRLIPGLTTERLTALAWHIIPVTIISILFVLTGVVFRFGGF